jgi:hypothetical protein
MNDFTKTTQPSNPTSTEMMSFDKDNAVYKYQNGIEGNNKTPQKFPPVKKQLQVTQSKIVSQGVYHPTVHAVVMSHKLLTNEQIQKIKDAVPAETRYQLKFGIVCLRTEGSGIQDMEYMSKALEILGVTLLAGHSPEEVLNILTNTKPGAVIPSKPVEIKLPQVQKKEIEEEDELLEFTATDKKPMKDLIIGEFRIKPIKTKSAIKQKENPRKTLPEKPKTTTKENPLKLSNFKDSITVNQQIKSKDPRRAKIGKVVKVEEHTISVQWDKIRSEIKKERFNEYLLVA